MMLLEEKSEVKIRSQKLLLLSSLVKREWHNLRTDSFSSYIDFNCLAGVGKFNGNISHANVFLEKWGRASGSNHATLLSLDENVLAVASNSSIAHFKSDQLSPDAFFLLLCQPFAPDEITFVQFGDPTQVGFQQGRGLINLMTIQAHAGFESQRVSCCQTARQHALV